MSTIASVARLPASTEATTGDNANVAPTDEALAVPADAAAAAAAALASPTA